MEHSIGEPMAALKNHRQERFCQLIKQGLPPYRAYPAAGYNHHDGAPYRLCGNVRVKQRIAEITKGLAMKTAVTVASITSDLDRITAGAEASEQWGAAKGAVETKAKLHGLLVDRKESGGPGEFATLKTADDVLALVRSELGEATAAALAAALAVDTDNQALPSEPVVEATPRGPDDVLN